jgi:hypothetical protein
MTATIAEVSVFLFDLFHSPSLTLFLFAVAATINQTGQEEGGSSNEKEDNDDDDDDDDNDKEEDDNTDDDDKDKDDKHR